jgi:hypothetical protein
MIHCDAIYVQSETVWWSTVILYMYNQRQCDDPLWYYICTVRDSVMIHCDTISFVLFNLFNYFLINDCSIIFLAALKLVLLSQTSTLSEMMLSCRYFQHVNQMPTLSWYMHANSIIIKSAIILNIKHNIFKLREKNLNSVKYIWCL